MAALLQYGSMQFLCQAKRRHIPLSADFLKQSVDVPDNAVQVDRNVETVYNYENHVYIPSFLATEEKRRMRKRAKVMLSDGLSYLLKGGPVMWPLFLCAIVSVTVMIERFFAISRAATDNEALLDQVKQFLSEGRTAEALNVAEQTRGPVASLVASGIRNQQQDADAVERAMEELALRETPILYRRLGILDTIITIAPLLGLLGTVTGMIRAFHVVGTQGLNAPTAITSGVAEALIATATGLAIAIVTLVGYNYLTEKVKELIAEMETRATQLLNILAELRGRQGRISSVTANSLP